MPTRLRLLLITMFATAFAGTRLITMASADPVGIYNANGTYEFAYGTAIPPTLTCAPDRVCSIQLAKGETIYDKVAGDTVHWEIGSGVVGRDGDIPLIFFSPLDTCQRNAYGACSGPLTTNLIVTTDEHTYELRLEAEKNVWRTRYGFFYPRDRSVTNTPRFSITHHSPPPTPAPTRSDFSPVGCLDTITNYRIDVSGNPNYAPAAVCNDGTHTYVVMRPGAAVPSIYEVLDNGQQSMVDSSPPINGVYTIAGVPNHLLLIGNVGKRVPHVDIYRLK